MKPSAISPLLKWAGGKRRFAKEFGDSIFRDVVARGGRYFEPFLGGGAVALYLGLPKMTLGDIEQDLIFIYQAVRDCPDDLVTILEALSIFGTTKEAYYIVRQTEPKTLAERAARMIYLNRLCFNGIWRKNKSGKFNVPYGGQERELPGSEKIYEISKVIQGASFYTGDFASMVASAGEGDTIYADPPYYETFSDYSGGGFDENDHERLAQSLWEAKERGAYIIAHNTDTEKVRYWYGEWADIVAIKEKRSVAASSDSRSDARCVLIVA